MALVNKPNNFSANTTISSSAVNDNFDTIYDEFNGNISEANLADSAVTEDKLASSAVTTGKIADDAITAAKIDWASTGANGGIWWEELGRTTLGSAGDTISVTSIPARKYLKILVLGIPSGAIDLILRFNNDSGSNYAARTATNDGADAGVTSQTGISINPDSAATLRIATIEAINVATQEKLVIAESMNANTAGAGNVPARRYITGKWANTAGQITRVDVVNLAAGDLAAGSEVVVLGHN